MRNITKYILPLFYVLALSSCNDSGGFTELGTVNGCDSAQVSCSVKQGKTVVSLTLGPHVVPLKPFSTVVTIQGMNVDRNSVIVDYQMKGMDMGVNRYRLLADNGRWSGAATLPVCSASRMDWIALVEFSANGDKYRARFPFQTAIQP